MQPIKPRFVVKAEIEVKPNLATAFLKEKIPASKITDPRLIEGVS